MGDFAKISGLCINKADTPRPSHRIKSSQSEPTHQDRRNRESANIPVDPINNDQNNNMDNQQKMDYPNTVEFYDISPGC